MIDELRKSSPAGSRNSARAWVLNHELAATNVQASTRDCRAFFDLSQDVFAISDLLGRLITVNAAAEKVLGFTGEDLSGVPIFELVHPDDRDQVLCDLSRYGKGEIIPASQCRCLCKDGSFKWMSWNVTPHLEDNKMYAIGRDISEQKEAETHVKEFYSIISHELRTPATSIHGALGLLEGGVVEMASEEALELIAMARSSANRLIRLINDILDVQKIEAGKLVLLKEKITPSQLVALALSEVAGMAQLARIELASTVTATEPLLVDCDRITQVLTNLIANAIKFSPGDSLVKITGEQKENGLVRFSVTDRGPGIADNQLDKLFKKFQQLDSSDTRQFGGTGLGLAICKAIVEQHGGTIGVDTAVGSGSVFWFELPL